jgi:hypothetical protein
VRVDIFANAYVPIVVTEFGIMIAVNPVPLKASSPMVTRELPRDAVVRVTVSANASDPKEVTEFGIVTDVSPGVFLKAVGPIEVTPFGICASPVHPPFSVTTFESIKK